MRFFSFFAGVLALATAAVTQGAPRDRFDDVRVFIRQQIVDKGLPSVAVAVVKDRKIVWEEGFGWADREKRITADEHTMYSLASISKSITATGLMVLDERGAIDLDKPVNDYLGSAKLRARVGEASSATVRAVANHRAGLPLHYQFFYEDEPWPRPSMDETILRYGNLMTPPGAHFNYSNLGYGVLDYVIERVSGMSYADFMRREVFLPLGMTRMSVGIGPGLAPYAAQRYAGDGTPIPFYTFDHPGGSAIYSSAHDLARFALFHLKAHLPDQKAILPDKTIDVMHRRPAGASVEDGYGIGFFDTERNGYRMVGHAGGMGGVASRMWMFPDEGLAIIVLVNSMTNAASEVANQIAAALLPKWKTAPPEPEKPAAFAPSTELIGVWKGTISTHLKDTPVELTIRPSGEMIATFGDQGPSLVDKPQLEDGWLTGQLRATIGTPDSERHPYTVHLALRQQDGGLSGAAIALGEFQPRVRNALSHWLALKKVP